jgi:hypothetical protein
MRYAQFKITEMAMVKSARDSSVSGYIDGINSKLAGATDKDRTFYVGASEDPNKVFTANPGQKPIKHLGDLITGKGKDHLGKDVTSVPAGNLFKSNEIKGETEDKLKFNRGEVSEGYHAIAAFVRLIARPTKDITLDQIRTFIPKLKNNQIFTLKRNETENPDLADMFSVTIALKPGSWKYFQNFAVLEDKDFASYVKDIIDDANDETGRRADVYANNNKYDEVRVIGDGVSGEQERKTDIEFENETEKKYRGYSIKAGQTSQIHQVGGGAVKDSNTSKAATPEQRYNILNDDLFGVHGYAKIADISSIKDKFIEMASSKKQPAGRLKAQEIAYREAVDSINKSLTTDNDEKAFLNTFVKALKWWKNRGDDDVLLKQFTGKGTIILDAKRLDKMQDAGLNLMAEYDEKKTRPQINIVDQTSGKKLVGIRTYYSDGYLRNYIEKGPLYVQLTNIAKPQD